MLDLGARLGAGMDGGLLWDGDGCLRLIAELLDLLGLGRYRRGGRSKMIKELGALVR